MTTHTPGPWRVEPDLEDKGGVEMSTGNCIGTADDYEWGYLRIEDARLIAAAPDLLAALKDLLAIYDAHLGGAGLPGVRAARAAIAKAEGV